MNEPKLISYKYVVTTYDSDNIPKKDYGVTFATNVDDARQHVYDYYNKRTLDFVSENIELEPYVIKEGEKVHII